MQVPNPVVHQSEVTFDGSQMFLRHTHSLPRLFFFFFFKSFYRPTGLAYDGRYTGNTGGHLRPHSPAADCNNDGPLKVAPHCSDAIPAPFTSLP